MTFDYVKMIKHVYESMNTTERPEFVM